MGIRQQESAPGLDKKNYATGHVYKCFKCNKWVKVLDDSEMCVPCMKANGVPRKLETFTTTAMIQANEDV